MSQPLQVFLGDYVPWRNKGEQAIIYGLQDMLSNGREVYVTMFGPDHEPVVYGNVTILPYPWIFATRLLDLYQHRWRRLSTWILFRAGLYGRLNRLLHTRDPKYACITKAFREADLVLVGHDGFFCIENCIMLKLAKQAGKRCGILGSGFATPPPLLSLAAAFYRMAIAHSDFCVFREKSAWEFMRSLAPNPERIRLEPDPAFFMKAASPEESRSCLRATPWYDRTVKLKRSIVAVTVCEKSVVFTGSFLGIGDSGEKRVTHTRFLATLLDSLIKERNAQIVFLPHSVEAGAGDDCTVAERVSECMTSDPDHRHILRGDLSARLLKGIIGEADFCVGERTHSLIGSLSVATPFLGLTNTQDVRTHDILGDMGQCQHLLLDMDAPSTTDAVRLLLQTFDQRVEVRHHLSCMSRSFTHRLCEVAKCVRQES